MLGELPRLRENLELAVCRTVIWGRKASCFAEPRSALCWEAVQAESQDGGTGMETCRLNITLNSSLVLRQIHLLGPISCSVFDNLLHACLMLTRQFRRRPRESAKHGHNASAHGWQLRSMMGSESNDSCICSYFWLLRSFGWRVTCRCRSLLYKSLSYSGHSPLFSPHNSLRVRVNDD